MRTLSIRSILCSIDKRKLDLPNFQRGFVWKREDVCKFMLSLYRDYPVGSMIIWATDTSVAARSNSGPPHGAIIDGQQRLTAIYGSAKGTTPPFFRGDENNILNLKFHLDDEKFYFYGPVKTRDNPRVINVNQVFKKGVKVYFDELKDNHSEYMRETDEQKLQKIDKILDKKISIEQITTNSSAVVLELFKAVNTGNKKLTSADLAFASICMRRPKARSEMRERLDQWRCQGYGSFKELWLLRGIAATLEGDAKYKVFDDISSEKFYCGLQRFGKHVDDILEMFRTHLGLDQKNVLRSHFSLIILARYLEINGGLKGGDEEIARLLYWYILTVVLGHYSKSSDRYLQRDLDILNDNQHNLGRTQIQKLIKELKDRHGSHKLSEEHIQGTTTNSSSYMILHILTRVAGARDLIKDKPLNEKSFPSDSLQTHHIFPVSRLKGKGKTRKSINRIANYALLTRESNSELRDKLPNDYLACCKKSNPEVLKSQWIPVDSRNWTIKKYNNFLKIREKNLARAANELLDQLRRGKLPQSVNLPG